MGDLDIHTQAQQHILHAQRISTLRKYNALQGRRRLIWRNLSKFWKFLAALITLVMISNPAAVVGRPEANGHAPVPPHDALYTRFNPPKEVLLQVDKLIVYHIDEDTSSQIPKSYCGR